MDSKKSINSFEMIEIDHVIIYWNFFFGILLISFQHYDYTKHVFDDQYLKKCLINLYFCIIFWTKFWRNI